MVQCPLHSLERLGKEHNMAENDMPEAGVHPGIEVKTNTDFVDMMISIDYVILSCPLGQGVDLPPS